MHPLLALILKLLPSSVPFARNDHRSLPLNDTLTEWTALGDSYAVGVGTGIDLGWGRCLRFSDSYAELMFHSDSSKLLAAQPQRILNFPACSGATTSDILAHQFDATSSFDLQYGERPSFGKNPAFATLTAGGDDIDFVNLVRNCVYDIIPWRSCDDQRAASWKMINDPKLVDKLDSVIKKAVETGRKGTAGDSFHVFVTSYAKFFNAETTQCDGITWSILPSPFGNRQKLTRGLRRDLNNMTDHLNAAIKKAVDRNHRDGVHFIDWDSNMNGHRYCEAGNTEPCDNCNSTWFWEYPQGDGPESGNNTGSSRNDEQQFKDHMAQIWHPDVKNFDDLKTKGPRPDHLPDVPESLHPSHKW